MENESVDSHNTREEVNDLIGDVIEIGTSKSLCPIYKITKEESFSPRGQIINLKKGVYTENLYKSALCMGADQKSIPFIPFSKIIRKARKVLIEQDKFLPTEEMAPLLKEINDYIDEISI